MSRVSLVIVAALLVGSACADSGDSAESAPPSVTLITTTTEAPPTTESTVAPTAASTATPTTAAEATTTEAPTTVAPTTSAADPSIDALVLTQEGIGAASFGSDPDGVIGYVSSFLGEPTNDTGWIDPLTIGACPGTEVRLVSWGVLTLQFGDASNVMEGRRHLYAYTYGVNGEIGGEPIGLETDQGIGVGSRLLDVTSAYPGVVLNPEDDFTAPNFYVNDNLRGFLTGLSDDSTVTVVLGGLGCGE